jgi:hypothetical protein
MKNLVTYQYQQQYQQYQNIVTGKYCLMKS